VRRIAAYSSTNAHMLNRALSETEDRQHTEQCSAVAHHIRPVAGLYHEDSPDLDSREEPQ
jgi:hypothetical protein